MSLCCTVSEILSVISQNLRSRDHKDIHFGVNLSCVRYTHLMNVTPNLKCLASKIRLGPKNLKGDMTLTTPLSGMVCIVGLDLLCSTYVPNFKSVASPVTKTVKVTQNVEIVVVWGI